MVGACIGYQNGRPLAQNGWKLAMGGCTTAVEPNALRMNSLYSLWLMKSSLLVSRSLKMYSSWIGSSFTGR